MQSPGLGRQQTSTPLFPQPTYLPRYNHLQILGRWMQYFFLFPSAWNTGTSHPGRVILARAHLSGCPLQHSTTPALLLSRLVGVCEGKVGSWIHFPSGRATTRKHPPSTLPFPFNTFPFRHTCPALGLPGTHISPLPGSELWHDKLRARPKGTSGGSTSNLNSILRPT